VSDLSERALGALRTCPACYGKGRVPYNGKVLPVGELVACARCDGTGDMLGALLMRAYRAGREDALEDARRMLEQTAAVVGRPFPTRVTPAGLLARVVPCVD